MTTKNFKRILSMLLLTVLIAAMALLAVGCDGNNNTGTTESPVITTSASCATELGEGAKTFDFTVSDFDGKKTAFIIHTDKETVGDALVDLGLLEGEDGPYGLYVKTVNGVTADFDKDGKYWAFYVDGEYAISGVDVTTIENGKTYAFKVE